MTNFLHTVAQDLIARFGNNLSDLTIVFPGKRASLFMNKYLLQCAGGRPVWAPHYITIDQLFLRRSPYTPSESIRNVCELYEVYRQEVPDAESLDRFYGWGEILISDFEDVDKQRVDVEKLFANVSDMAELETVDYLTDDQKRVVGQFFSEFKGDDTELKKRFRSMWNRMLSLYEGLRARLAADGLMYKGAIYENIIADAFSKMN
ncbi:MAG: PD-(D/E)XK nuclease family protein, partial [Bacteroidaceae bacterium]|nr:PD-(D/E)XK nuclease family protein [Bacteroidaceae bacterium]